MKIAVEGCCHGELDKIYETVQYLEQVNNIKVDLLLICGDFQAIRNKEDMKSMAVPPKYQKLNTFYKYYSGEKEAPLLTIFIGGNHEASNFLQELPYGGWVAKNIYYMGYASVIQVGGIRIGGLSGIYKARDYNRGHYEYPPYTDDTKRSVYHVRNVEVFRLEQLTRPMDIFMSHDWPANIAQYGDMERLFRAKPFLREEVLDGSLGSPPAERLLHKLQPSYWFSAHLHVKFAAWIQHSNKNTTKFLSLDKCLPRKQFLQVLDIPHHQEEPLRIKLDAEWLCVLKSTNHLLNLTRSTVYMPGPGSSERYNFEVTDQDIDELYKDFGNDLTLPENFEHTAPTIDQQRSAVTEQHVRVNPQTSLLCSMLDVTDPNAVILGQSFCGSSASSINNPDEVDIEDDTEEENLTEAPSYINSSLDASCTDTSLSMSDSFTSFDQDGDSLKSGTFSSSTPTHTRVADDDEELVSILAAQRRISGKLEFSEAVSPAWKTSSSGVETSTTKDSDLTSSITQEHRTKHDECANGMCGAELKPDESIMDIGCSSQESKDLLEPQNTSNTEESQGSQSNNEETEEQKGDCSGPEDLDDSLQKRKTSSENVSGSGGKKLKRRNESFYSVSATENEDS
ncbi:lariat debranching enzyme-like [Pomacea canaliculata]|uniref:lariat debranching enzyme-like n=1 Tax=Pomacea canaliculata TaxID=400727 RepID=UPI000D72934C|nr:lariat debranching enzyme-like [Pomacea canaliculata]XP_025106943.1 lariat debranching enzyme-like [Pomacea canaliculata]